MKQSYTVKEAEQRTGISCQNIRFYERQGLLAPKRNHLNGYREYTNADIHTLQVIRLLRMLDMPLEQIQQVLSGSLSLSAAAQAQQARLEAEQARLTDAITLCKTLAANPTPLHELDVETLQAESNSGAFSSRWLSDWKAVAHAAHQNSFTFFPDTPVTNAAEFSHALQNYALENNLNLVFTKESMYPEFTLDGIAYTACRNYTPIGRVPTACIYCERITPIHPQLPPLRRRILSFLHYGWPYLLIAFLVLVGLIPMLADFWKDSPLGTLVLIATILILSCVSIFRSRYFLFHEKGHPHKKD